MALLLGACGGGGAETGPVELGGPEASISIEIDDGGSEGNGRLGDEGRARPALAVDLPDDGGDGGTPGRAGGSTLEGSEPVDRGSSPNPSDGAGPTSSAVPSGPTSSAVPSGPTSSAVPSGPTRSLVAHAAVPRVVARTGPRDDAPPVASLANPTEVGSPLVFLVDDTDGNVPGWLRVHLPIQPNGTRGWVRRDEVTLFANDYRVEVDRAAHRLRVFDGTTLWIETPIAVGTGETPTPVGEFYLLELLSPPDPNGPYGPYAFGLSGFSEVLDSFGGADTAIIGLHGTDDPSAIGTDVSFGCIRVTNDVISQMAQVVPLGTPVVIT